MISLKDNSQSSGKLTVQTGAVHIETGATPVDVDLGTILEANFSDEPFQLPYFSSVVSPDQLPAGWKEANLDNATPTGETTYAKGLLTITGGGSDFQRAEKEDRFFFGGVPWSGDGQFTAHLISIEPHDSHTLAGPMFRESLDPLAVMSGMGTFAGDEGNGLFLGRGKTGEHEGWNGFPSSVPSWLHLTWLGNSMDLSVSPDGKTWDLVNQSGLSDAPVHWFGFFVDSLSDKLKSTVTFDQISFTPAPAKLRTVPPGVLLTSGSFLAGSLQYLNPQNGSLNYGLKSVPITVQQVAVVVAHPVTTRQLSELEPKTGLLLKNEDFLESDLQGIQGNYFVMNSVLLGPVPYGSESIRAALLNPVKPIPSEYELRMKDGSIIQANSVTVTDAQIAIAEVSGLTFNVKGDQVAQIRAGSAHVLNLVNLDWKAKGPDVATATVPAAPPATATPKAAPAPAAPNVPPASPTAANNAATTPASTTNVAAAIPAPPTDQPTASVETWQGPNQEQIIVASSGSSIDFPLRGKFRALSLRVALSPDSPPDGHAALSVLSDGKEVGRTPLLAAGAAPALISVKVGNPKTVTFAVSSPAPGTRLLIIDPVAIRDTDTP